MSGTIRSRAEERKAAHSPGPSILREERCAYCSRAWPCPDWVAADDTLTDLNNAEITHEWEYPTRADARMVQFRLIPDPDSRGAEETRSEREKR